MSIPNLPVNFKDDILSSSNQRRKYTKIDNYDGTFSLEDSTEYSQKGSEFGAKEINETNEAVNNIYDERILTLEEAALVTQPGLFVDAEVISKLIGNIKTAQTFDQDEIDTGETWVDGKKIYRRTFVTTDVLAGDEAISIPISFGHDSIWIDRGNSFIKSDQWIYPIPLPRYSNSDDSYVGIWIEASKIVLFSGPGSGWNESWTKVVTVRYTKK